MATRSSKRGVDKRIPASGNGWRIYLTDDELERGHAVAYCDPGHEEDTRRLLLSREPSQNLGCFRVRRELRERGGRELELAERHIFTLDDEAL